MKFDWWDKIESLFYKHMYFPKRQDVWDFSTGDLVIQKEVGELISEGEVSDCIYHNMEYIKWGFDRDSQPYFHWTSLDIFYKQEENFEKMSQDFCAWLLDMQHYLQRSIVCAVRKMKHTDVYPKRMTLPQNWRRLLPHRFIFDLECAEGKPYIYSEDIYGKMISIEGID